jgi:hypothetical protein
MLDHGSHFHGVNPLDAEVCEVAANFPGCLIFNTTIATLKLVFDTTPSPMSMSPDGVDVGRKVNIYDAEGNIVGCLKNSCRDLIGTNFEDGQLYDFIVICGTLEN